VVITILTATNVCGYIGNATQFGKEERMPLLNYTTKIPAETTVTQIQQILVKHGATDILTHYANGKVHSLSFKVKIAQGPLAITLPVDVEATQRVLRRTAPRAYWDETRARNVAWRIIKDWVEAQMAILETEMVSMAEIFLPYVVTADGRTVFQRLQETAFQLPERTP
jgi:hypothetical protein